MACSRGKASPNAITQRQLWASSAGYCQNPKCLTKLFRVTGTSTIHIAEMAHIIAAANEGPRADPELVKAARGDFNNLIVLCTSCHTMIDKAPQDHPETQIKQWKADHCRKLEAIFSAPKCSSRPEARQHIEPLLAENAALFNECGPHVATGSLADLGLANRWRTRMRENIIPNNRRMLSILDINRTLLRMKELQTLEELRIHVLDLEARHFANVAVAGQRRFPEGMPTMLVDP